MLDSYEVDGQDREELMRLTNDGERIEAVLNLHPFHTVHCKFVHDMVPHSRLIGTRRHHRQNPELSWDPALIEDEATQKEFADIFDFSVPAGVDFIPDDESVHVGSVIVRERASGIIHVDDTLMIIELPALVEKFLPGPKLRFHPKLTDALEKRAGAADDFIAWARQLQRDWADTQIICAAHSGILRLTEESFADVIEKALDHVAGTLDDHRKTYG
ncbi:hypothetical protein [Parasphingorhabdus sp.]|uniref:hypothetical protein n=1 Tax=Parasphingorhabdus sp. TaxID=2709688 RepID=UPI0030020AC8